jgi:hypothetical protein
MHSSSVSHRCYLCLHCVNTYKKYTNFALLHLVFTLVSLAAQIKVVIAERVLNAFGIDGPCAAPAAVIATANDCDWLC